MRESCSHAGRAGSPEVSSSNLSGPATSSSAGSLGVQDFMNPEILKTAKLWRFQKLSREQQSMESICHKDLPKAIQKSLETTGKLVVIQFIRLELRLPSTRVGSALICLTLSAIVVDPWLHSDQASGIELMLPLLS